MLSLYVSALTDTAESNSSSYLSIVGGHQAPEMETDTKIVPTWERLLLNAGRLMTIKR